MASGPQQAATWLAGSMIPNGLRILKKEPLQSVEHLVILL